MQYISSDSCVWIDFSTIDRTELPFRLPYTYIMNEDTIEEELNINDKLGSKLISYGLVPVELTIEEFELAESYGIKYIKLSRYDRIALAIAKVRNIVLLTGDKRLKVAATHEGVIVFGTIGLLDQLKEQACIDTEEYRYCLLQFQANNGMKVRLPSNEISIRLRRLEE